jgi:hypothetical protein
MSSNQVLHRRSPNVVPFGTSGFNEDRNEFLQ